MSEIGTCHIWQWCQEYYILPPVCILWMMLTIHATTPFWDDKPTSLLMNKRPCADNEKLTHVWGHIITTSHRSRNGYCHLFFSFRLLSNFFFSLDFCRLEICWMQQPDARTMVVSDGRGRDGENPIIWIQYRGREKRFCFPGWLDGAGGQEGVGGGVSMAQLLK